MLGISSAFILIRELWQAIRWADEVANYRHPQLIMIKNHKGRDKGSRRPFWIPHLGV